MKRSLALLLVGLLLAGCSTVGNVFKKTGRVLMDPSIPVGAPDDQPTQIALSLYASADVNPNPVSASAADSAAVVDEPTEEKLVGEGPYSVSFNGATKGELISGLRALLDHLQGEEGIVPLPSHGTGRPLPNSLTVTPTGKPPLPPDGQLRRSPLLADAPGVAPNLGQYRKGDSLAAASALAPASPAQASSTTATPVAFQVLQLKDDSMLENADLDLVSQNPKKALGSTFIAADDYTLAPGQFKFIEFSPIEDKARYVAVVAAFHDVNATRRYDVFRLEPRGRKYALLVTLQDTRVTITNEAYRAPDPSREPARGAQDPQRKPVRGARDLLREPTDSAPDLLREPTDRARDLLRKPPSRPQLFRGLSREAATQTSKQP
ncbi:type VI secretion system lipoprotein TssJ [Burkholderia cenocepacia]|uniref:Type VI secretion system lipoprotein TssJ n=1 Tax=Burkholderia cenocepacia TaxID=95486 RepID=A0A3S9N6G1_9BURK|nr:type VI secretion system lipoprotein TssJ [Burkholderia cenocepacia]AZQ51269.1 type VI secretion system lipoprotein TssJ [Burkholderia cenocepacia]